MIGPAITAAELLELREAIRKEEGMSFAERLLREDDESYWLVPCKKLLAEIDRLRAEISALRLSSSASCEDQKTP